MINNPAYENAFISNHPEVMELLREAGANAVISQENKDLGPGLAVKQNRGEETVEFCLELGANANARFKDEIPALHLACESERDVSAMRLLLKASANIEAKDTSKADVGQTALLVACRNGNQGGVRTLIEAGADVNTKVQSGKTAYQLAYRSEKYIPGLGKLLSEAGADTTVRQIDKDTGLHNAIMANDVENALMYLADGADIHTKIRVENAYEEATRRGNREIAQILLDHGAHPWETLGSSDSESDSEEEERTVREESTDEQTELETAT